jgi:ABC-type branched-subunit amino acid transport system substrate-binding protein
MTMPTRPPPTPLRLVLCLAALSALLGCVRSSEGVSEPEKPRYAPRKDPAADEALKKAAEIAQASQKPKAIEAYLNVSKTYAETTAAQEALYRAGVLSFESGDYVNARKAFNQLLYENPLFDKAQDAKLKLGLSALEVRAYRDAYQTLSSVAPRLPADSAKQALEGAERAAEAAQLYGDSLRIALKLLDDAKTPQEQQVALDRVTLLVEGKAGFTEIVEAAQTVSTSSLAWPILTFKIARIYYHLRDWGHLEESLQSFLRQAPQHPFAQQAQELLSRARRRSEAKPKVVGVVLSLSGQYKLYGEAVMRGIRLALQGSDVELVVKDSKGDPAVAGKAVEELAFDDGAIAILGPLLPEESRRAALVADELGVPILTLTRAEKITEFGTHVFRNMLADSAQAEALAQYAIKVLGYKSFAVLYPNVPYGTELANQFWDRVVEHGGQIRGAERYASDQKTFTAEVKKLVGRYYLDDRSDYLEKAKEITSGTLDSFRKRKALEKLRASLTPVVDFQALFIPEAWSTVGLIAPALAVEDVITNACDPKDLEKIRKTTGRQDLETVTLLGSAQWGSKKGRNGIPELVERGGKFVMCSVYVDGFFVDSSRPATQKFVSKYGAAYKDEEPPGLLEATAFDSAGMIRKTIESFGPRTRTEFRDHLSATKNFDGATGRTTFNDHREAEKPLFFLTIDKDGVREISPTDRPQG